MTTPARLADRITATAGSVDLSGFAPFLAPVMSFMSENFWPATTLIASLVAILLITFVIIGWRWAVVATSPPTRSPLPQRREAHASFRGRGAVHNRDREHPSSAALIDQPAKHKPAWY